MNAMLLTAGKGVRMLPLSLTLPKPAIPVLGRPIATQILHRLARAGINRAVLNLHHLPDIVRGSIEGSTARGLPAIEFVYEEEILGTAGGIGNAASLLRGEGPILIHNGDFLSDIDLDAASNVHMRSGMAATLVLAPSRAGYPTVDVDRDGRVISLAGLPEVDNEQVAGSYLFTGCHLMDEHVLELMPAGRPSDMIRDVYRRLAGEGRIGSYLHRGFWWEFGSPELYLLGSLALLDLTEEHRQEIAPWDTVTTLDSAIASVGDGVRVGDGARIISRAVLGSASWIGVRARLEDTVVMPGASVGAGCRLRRAVIAPHAHLPDGMEVEEAIVCHRPDDRLIHPFAGSGSKD
jgi:mannose-1-phosphate guanylyltransferase